MSNGKCMRLYELLVLMSILAVLIILAARFLSASSGTIDQLNTGWSVNDGVNEYEDVDLQSFRIRKTISILLYSGDCCNSSITG